MQRKKTVESLFIPLFTILLFRTMRCTLSVFPPCCSSTLHSVILISLSLFPFFHSLLKVKWPSNLDLEIFHSVLWRGRAFLLHKGFFCFPFFSPTGFDLTQIQPKTQTLTRCVEYLNTFSSPIKFYGYIFWRAAFVRTKSNS